MVIIRQASIAELEHAPHIEALLEEYAQESAINGLPNPRANIETYKALEKSGHLQIIGAFIYDYLIGYMTVLCSELPHYSERAAIVESFFVMKEHRKTGAGLKLLDAGETRAKSCNTTGILISAPIGGILAEVLPHRNYTETNRVFFKSFSTALAIPHKAIPAMTEEAIDKVRDLEATCLTLPQEKIVTHHVLHGGMYSRTITIPAGILLTGALIKIPTMLIVEGDAVVYLGDNSVELTGYNVLPASANRKQAFAAKTDTNLTMIFPTNAKTVEDAEAEFTDQADMLFSRLSAETNKIVITGE